MSTQTVLADVSASVWQVEIEIGATVVKGDLLVVLESMKMEIPVEAPAAGRVIAIAVVPGQTVAEDDLLVTIEVDDA
jgi:biotin carboxyl carrier protein